MAQVNINIQSPVWATIANFKKWKESLLMLFQATVKEVYDGHKAISVNMLLTDDADICQLNKVFRGKDAATNVLSFPQYSREDICKIDTLVAKNCIEIGDIAISYGVIVRESAKLGLDFLDRCSHLFVHGVLHLFGLGHVDDTEAKQMEAKEIKILSQFGVSNPYKCSGNKALWD
ncbi:MAG: rRNA maturation RNase YbeY [Holosporales bacterium]|nr:rRNA maturation RNase YbeY [Holosporales bacterium]